MADFLIAILQFILIITIAPLISGIIHKTKSLLRGSKGASIFQPYYNILKLFQKEVVLSKDASWISIIAPYIVAAVPIVLAGFLPVFNSHTLFSFNSDIIALVYTLALGTFFLALYGFDQASSFGGLGSSREMMVASLAEPALMMVIFTFALQSNSTNISTIFEHMHKGEFLQFPVSSIFALMALYFVIIAESGRIPIDNPETHLELTMIHEAMILDASGRSLALLEIGSFIKTAIFLTLFSNIFIPFGLYEANSFLAIFLGILIYIIKMSLLAVIIAIGEMSLAKLRYFRIPDAMMFGFVLSLISMIVYRL